MSIKSYLSLMRGCKKAGILKAAVVIISLSFFSGCAKIHLTEGGLAIGKDTTACIEDLGVASLRNRF